MTTVMGQETVQNEAKVSFFKMFFLGFVVALPSTLGGFVEGYATLALPEMNLTVQEASWFGSVIGFGAPVGAVLLGVLVDVIGRRNSIVVGMVPHLVGWSLLAWDHDVVTVIVGRFLTGLPTGALFYPGQVYVAECLPDRNKRLRSSIVTWFGITGSVGLFVVLFLAYFFSYRVIAAVAALLTFALMALVYVAVPESPVWLYLRGRVGDAELSTKRLGLGVPIVGSDATLSPQRMSPRQPPPPPQPPPPAAVSERRELRLSTKLRNLRKLRRKDVYKPICVLTVACVLFSFCGAHAIFVYMVDVVGTQPDTAAHAGYSTSLVAGFLVLVAHTLISFVLPVVGVRKLTVTSCVCTAAALVLLGYVTERRADGGGGGGGGGGGDDDLRTWRSVAVCLITFSYNFGVQFTPLAIMGDSFPADAKAFAGIPIMTLCVASAVVTKVHPFLAADFGAHLYYMYAGAAFLGALYVTFYFYETVGKSLDEINAQYRR